MTTKFPNEKCSYNKQRSLVVALFLLTRFEHNSLVLWIILSAIEEELCLELRIGPRPALQLSFPMRTTMDSSSAPTFQEALHLDLFLNE